MKSSIILILMCLLMFTFCRKKGTEPVPYIESKDYYQPMIAGSFWLYEDDSTKIPIVDTIKVTDKDTVIAGDSYRIFTASLDSSQIYLTRIKGNYYNYNFKSTLPSLSNVLQFRIGNINSFKFLYMKDNLKMGDKWFNEFKNPYFIYRSYHEVVDTLSSLTINNHTFNDVISINISLKQRVNTDYLPITGVEFLDVAEFKPVVYYYAKNVGLVKTSSGQSLKAYLVK